MALAIRKCCARGKNININGGSCTDHFAKEDENGKGQKISKAFFLETPLPQKGAKFFEGFLPSKMGQIKKITHIIMYTN